jgi:hypothetical protein
MRELFMQRERSPAIRLAVLPLLLFLVSAGGFSQDSLALGQNLRSYLKDHPPTLKAAGKPIIDIPEGVVDVYRYEAKAAEGDIRILVILDKYPVGVVRLENGKPHLLYDLSGDGVLDAEMPGLEVPYWVVADNTDERLRTGTNNIKLYLDGFYTMFQDDANPFTSGKAEEYLNLILKKVTSGPVENRDILYALYCCYKWGNSYPAGTTASSDYLAKSYFTRFKADHPLFYLQFLESFINAGMRDDARRTLDGLLKLDPSYIPAQVYRWQLETEPEKKKQYFAELKRQHPRHWIVSQIQPD